MRKTIPVLMSMVVLMVASLALAQPGPGGRGPGGPGGPGGQGPMAPGGGLVEFLGLDDAQLEKWNAYHEEFRGVVEPLHESMQALHVQLRDALDAETPIAGTIGQLMLDIDAVRDQIAAAREALDADLESILTADQVLKLEAFRAAQAHMRGNGRGQGGPGQGKGFGPGNGSGCGAGSGN